MNIVLLGYPGSGKGTQSELLCRELELIHIATGDILREEINKGTELGEKVKEYLSTGKLVDDRTILEIIRNKISRVSTGFLFDGFPRTYEQAEGLDDILAAKSQRINAVIFLSINEEEVINRLALRRVCPKCNRVYNIASNPPRKEETCDDCMERLIQREDDRPEVLKKRFMVYNQLTEPLISYYKSNADFFEVDAASSVEEVFKKVMGFLHGAESR